MAQTTKPNPKPKPQSDEPTPTVTPPQPATMALLKVLQNTYDQWIAAGGTPPIYGPVAPPIFIYPPQ
jgi:hypothetical protein